MISVLLAAEFEVKVQTVIFILCGAPQWNVVRWGATRGRWAVRRGAGGTCGGETCQEEAATKLVESTAEPWKSKGQLAGSFRAAFRRCQANQGQLSGIASQAGMAHKAQPDSRRGQSSCKEELVSCSRRTCLRPYQVDRSEEEDR